MKSLQSTIVPALLLALFGIAGCHGHGQRCACRNAVGGWTAPAAPHLEYADPQPDVMPDLKPAPVPAPSPPEAVIHTAPNDEVSFPSYPEADAPSRSLFSIFDEVGHTRTP